ncbi:MAG TPA: MerR family transcriptional regulator [Pyrinomonadaceae bacterium]|nr:MerR family transcriptional regulator [Pyrinomonadaceae bacterium]
MTDERLYRASEFAREAGVTVRALHHYDRLGLLKPTRRTAAGYRLYGEQDFARLQQIVTLKFIGFPLRQIKDVLDRDRRDLATTLRFQRIILAEKSRRLTQAVRAIEEAERALAGGAEPGRETFAKIIEVIEMQNDTDWTKKYYSEEAQARIAERQKTIPREVIEQGQRDWMALITEVEAAVQEGVSPESERAQGLAARWSELIRGFTGGDPEIQKGLNKMYSDPQWGAPFPKPYSDEAGEFIARAIKSRRQD